MFRSKESVKVILSLIAVLITAVAGVSCGGGGGGGTSGGILGEIQPIPGATVVPSVPVDTSRVNAYIDSATGNLNVAGHAGAASPNATVRIVNSTGEITITAFADGSFHNNGVMPPGFNSASGETIEIYQMAPSFAISDPAMVTVN